MIGGFNPSETYSLVDYYVFSIFLNIEEKSSSSHHQPVLWLCLVQAIVFSASPTAIVCAQKPVPASASWASSTRSRYLTGPLATNWRWSWCQRPRTPPTGDVDHTKRSRWSPESEVLEVSLNSYHKSHWYRSLSIVKKTFFGSCAKTVVPNEYVLGKLLVAPKCSSLTGEYEYP